MLEWLKYLIAGRELAALNRYRYACHLVWRWMGNYPASANTADWIRQVGEDERGADVAEFRGRVANEIALSALDGVAQGDGGGERLSTPEGGDGEIIIEAVGRIVRLPDNDRRIDWLIEGGVAGLGDGDTLCVTTATLPDDGLLILRAATPAGGGDGLVQRFKLACKTLIRERVVFGEDVETLHDVLLALESLIEPGKPGNYEWFDVVAGIWKPVNRLPYTWERELGIQWREASLGASAPAGVPDGVTSWVEQKRNLLSARMAAGGFHAQDALDMTMLSRLRAYFSFPTQEPRHE